MKKATSKSSSKETTTGRTMGVEVNKSTSTSISRIENGFLISETGYVGKGKNQHYVEKRYFSPTNPVAGIKIKFGK